MGNRFKEEYPAAASRLREFYSQMRMRAIQRETRVEGESPHLILHQSYARQKNLSSRSCDIEVSDFKGVAWKPGNRTVWVTRLEYTFSLLRHAGQENYVFQQFTEQYACCRSLELSFKPLFAATSWLDADIEEFLNSADCRINNVSDVADGESLLVRVEWELFNPKSLQWGWFLFSPEDSWALREVTRYGGMKCDRRKSFATATITYDGHFNGMPLLRRYHQWVEFHGLADDAPVVQGKPVQIIEYDVDLITPGEVPEDEFILEFFGPQIGECDY